MLASHHQRTHRLAAVTPPPPFPPPSPRQRLFGLPSDWLPDVAGTNAYYGGGGASDTGVAPLPAGTNILFSQGAEDPWQWAGVRGNVPDHPTELANVVACPGCAHCVDLYTPSPTDAPALVAERTQAKALVAQWLADAAAAKRR
jgi:hypothetical protein